MARYPKEAPSSRSPLLTGWMSDAAFLMHHPGGILAPLAHCALWLRVWGLPKPKSVEVPVSGVQRL
ncbi:uncharacterized protein BO96DRAFT_436835 [Aspergillus niger CBS 101883]|uniref:Uncharacterized protein n=2 Tax=Aspergillus niger TaxID=5061 RepID=A2QY79_ASPNC|nr:uncharacterized protein BO96DRAFT_436835 [Aspergillus niger CBS 101883]XP_059601740.1 hypothetical protein An12g00300 [Aspergillus niger]PYH53537.1 hypothetical protein BO96DRAFT_436835 [Aspergillus niger CBS 101883]CAK40959.1 hypothetical protein An12g00300 [Aspergillus niger]